MASTLHPRAQDDAIAAQRTLVHALLAAARRRDRRAPTALIETHISYVLLTGRIAYKIKKAVDFGFLDFRTLARRRHFCAEELRLNRRLAAAIYIGLVAIRGTPETPHIDDDVSAGAAEPIEYAVKMLEFAQSALFDRLLAQGALPTAQIDALAERVARFHAAAANVPPDADIGSPEQIWRLAAENFASPEGVPESSADSWLDVLAQWSRVQYARLGPLFAQRRAGGFVRECHGDLHLGNIALHEDQPLVFDCIEFCDELRWIDVINEVAFLCMDLEERGRPDLAWRFLNRYLETTGDYAGLPCLPFYRVYRALVRAKIAGLRAAQEAEAGPAARRERTLRAQYLVYARRSIEQRGAAIVLMHGVSGSGKTWTAQVLLERLGAVRLRSDVERKRLYGIPAQTRSAAPLNAGLYDRASGEATYRRLAELTRSLVNDGFTVLVDAANLAQWQRSIFLHLADALGVPLCLVSCHADEATLRRRLAARAAADNDASDAGLAILDAQLRNSDPLTPAEVERTLLFDADRQSPEELEHALRARLFNA